MRFSLFFFSGRWPDTPGDHYRLFRDSVQFADRCGFEAVWTPERHFHRFGGLYPNPSLTGAALAVLTTRIGIRAGSVVAPLQDPLRIAEEWSVVDNLSQGRVGVSFASGWNVNDFALQPESYENRHAIMHERIEIVRRLWRGETVSRRNGTGKEVELSIFPRPYQPEIPIWITAQSDRSCVKAGEIGAKLLTNLNYHALGELRTKIGLYRAAFASRDGFRADLHGRGHATVMVHTFIGDEEAIERQGKPAYAEYLRTNLDLQSERAQGMGLTVDSTEEDIRALIARAVNRMIGHVGLIGTPEECLRRARGLAELGVDEVACLIDFGVEAPAVMSSLEHVAAIGRAMAAEEMSA
jgi:natural product biosynthesis luciferase-like monooxygenase protein